MEDIQTKLIIMITNIFEHVEKVLEMLNESSLDIDMSNQLEISLINGLPDPINSNLNVLDDELNLLIYDLEQKED